MKVWTYTAPSSNPHKTLALEQALLETLGPNEIILLLYRHRDSVILGRNQNAWAECRHKTLAAEGGTLARRISGGGAVFHDSGNLNFSFIVPHSMYDVSRQSDVLVDAVRSLGISAQRSGRNDLTAGGLKFSGNAFCVRKHAAFHHGTLLVDTNTAKMERYLSVDPGKFQSRGITSVRARVVNLRELRSDLSVEMVSDALIDAFCRAYGRADPFVPRSDQLAYAQQLAVRNASWDWVFGHTPDFAIQFSRRFAWGGIEFRLVLHHAVVTQAQVYSDALNVSYVLRLTDALHGVPFRTADLSRTAHMCARGPDESAMARDISDLFAAGPQVPGCSGSAGCHV